MGEGEGGFPWAAVLPPVRIFSQHREQRSTNTRNGRRHAPSGRRAGLWDSAGVTAPETHAGGVDFSKRRVRVTSLGGRSGFLRCAPPGVQFEAERFFGGVVGAYG